MKIYWPQISSTQVLIKHFVDTYGRRHATAADGSLISVGITQRLTSTTSNGKRINLLQDFDSNFTWLDTWNYIVDPLKGVLETGDQFPNSSAPGGYTAVYFEPGGEIFWGNIMSVGQSVGKQIVIASMKKTAMSYGYQSLYLAALHPSFSVLGKSYANVVQLLVDQVFCANSDCSSVNGYKLTYFLAPNFGHIRIDYHDRNWVYQGSHFLADSCTSSNVNQFYCR